MLLNQGAVEHLETEGANNQALDDPLASSLLSDRHDNGQKLRTISIFVMHARSG
jgi:hypothetical protein